MPRRPRVRIGRPTTAESVTPEQRAWLSRLKEEAVSQLPVTTPLEAKVQLRRDVEQAVARYGPADSVQEVQDIVTMLVEQARRKIEEAAEASQREQQKASHLQLADLALRLALGSCPHSLVGPPGSLKREQVLASLRPKLRGAFLANLTGEESEADILRQVRDWVLAWQADQEPARHGSRVSPGRILTCLSGAAALVDALARVPAVRDAINKGLSVLQAQVTHSTPPPDPPKPATGG